MALATLPTSPCWLRPLAALARRAGVLSRPQGCAPVAGGSAAEARVGAASASALSGNVGCVVGGGRDVVLALELALDEWCS